MVPKPSSPFKWDYWTSSPPDVVELTCFMPNACYIPLEMSRDATMHEVKEDLWEKATKYPCHDKLHHMSVCVFQFVNALANLEEVEDEGKRLRDLRPVCGVLKLVERRKDKVGDKLLNTQISHLIGKGLNDFDALQDSEVNDFRARMRLLGEERTAQRAGASWLQRLSHRFPPRLAPSRDLPPTLLSRLRNNKFVLVAKFENTETSFTFNVKHSTTPSEMISTILAKKAHSLNQRGGHPADFVLKVCGREEYLVGEHPLSQFLYIQETLSSDGVPTIVTVSIDKVPLDSNFVYAMSQERPRASIALPKKEKTVCSWDIADNLSCTVRSVGQLNIDTTRQVEVVVLAGVFHGDKSLCEAQKTCEAGVSAMGEVTWHEELRFPINVCNIPRMARLCFSVYEISKTAKGIKNRKIKDANKEPYINPLAWVNTTVFDYKNALRTGTLTLYTWTIAEDMQSADLLHPLGTVESNVYDDQSAALTLHFTDLEK